MQIKSLEKLGLTDKETKVYLAALELGEAPVLIISQKAKLKRANTYVILEELTKKGLVSTMTKGKKRHFVAEPPETLMFKLQEKEFAIKEQQKRIKELLPELKSIHNLSEKETKVRFYEGIESLKSLYLDTLKEKKPLHSFTAFIPNIEPEFLKWLNDYYIPKRVENKIFIKVISPASKGSGGGLEYKKKDKESYRQTMLIPPDKFPFSVEIIIYHNKIALVSYKSKELIGVIIESKEIAKTMQFVFNLSWEKARDYQK